MRRRTRLKQYLRDRSPQLENPIHLLRAPENLGAFVEHARPQEPTDRFRPSRVSREHHLGTQIPVNRHEHDKSPAHTQCINKLLAKLIGSQKHLENRRVYLKHENPAHTQLRIPNMMKNPGFVAPSPSVKDGIDESNVDCRSQECILGAGIVQEHPSQTPPIPPAAPVPSMSSSSSGQPLCSNASCL